MIAYIEWKIVDSDISKIIVLTDSWLWYEIWWNFLDITVFQDDKKVSLYIYHHRTENSQNLFGFQTREEKQIFEELIKINWIGWKVALNILSIWIDTLINAVSSHDNATIEAIKWIGKKWASKIILELKDKDFVKQYQPSSWATHSWDNTYNNNLPQDIKTDVTHTLVTMWYQISDIEKTLANLPESYTTLEEILPWVIRNV